MDKKKLYINLTNSKIINYYSIVNEKIQIEKIESIPFFFYPNYTPCYEANAYILYKLRFGYSQRNGGSLGIIANHLSHFIRYTFNSPNINSFINYNDNLFSNFIEYLQLDEAKRSNNQIIRIAHQVIDFLFFIADLYSLNSFIGVGKSNRINLFLRKKNKINFGAVYSSYYIHYSFPSPSPLKKRYPIILDDYKKLLNYIDSKEDEGIKLRNRCLIQALEHTGARRDEVCSLTISSIRTALKSTSNSPLLEITTLKSKIGKKIRLVPVSRTFLLNLRFYIQYYRNNILKKIYKNTLPHDYIFISHTTGKPISPDTLTTYIHTWSKKANLSTQVCAHMFRHRFITERFKALILEYDVDNKDDFRKVLLNTNRLKQILIEWTGHSSIHSLDTYINLAFDELTKISEIKKNFIPIENDKFTKERLKFIKDLIEKNRNIDPMLLYEFLKSLELD